MYPIQMLPQSLFPVGGPSQTNQYLGMSPGQNFEVNQFASKVGEFGQSQQVEDVSFDLSRKESFVANVSRRYQDFNDEESFGEENEIVQKNSRQAFNGNMLDANGKPNNSNMITPQKNFERDENYGEGDLSPISHNNNQSRITIQSYLISHDGKDHQSKPSGVRRSSSWHNNMKNQPGTSNSSKFITTPASGNVGTDNYNFGKDRPMGITNRQIGSDTSNLLFDTNF